MAHHQLNVFLALVAFLATVGVCLAARPFGESTTSTSAQHLISAVCSSVLIRCSNLDILDKPSASDTAQAASLRDQSIMTINDLQMDFFQESDLVEGGWMSLADNLRDPAPRRPFLSPSAAAKLPSLSSSSAVDLMRYFGVARDSDMASSIATAAYLCGSAALPGEARACAASIQAMVSFVASELGRDVKLYSTTAAPALASAAAAKAPVAIVDVVKGSPAEGKRIVVCHHIAFPSALFYCHRVTGTKIVQATLKPDTTTTADRIDAVAICHLNTEQWLSRHPAFKALNIARGQEACHMLVENDIVFAPAMALAD